MIFCVGAGAFSIVEAMGPMQQKREDPDWVKEAARAHIHYRVPGMERVPIRRDLTFKSTDDGPLVFDAYGSIPEKSSAPSPAVILVHGGPVPANLLTTPREWGLFDSFGRLMGASGIAAIVFNHRFFGYDKAPQALGDIQDLVAHVSSNAESLGIDATRLCLWFFSGGGVFLGHFLKDSPAAIRCIVAYYAVLHAPVPQFSAATQVAETSGRIPPMLVARAGLDMPQLNEGIDYFVQQALKKNATLDLLNHSTGQHGFDGRDDNERTRDILRRTVEFIHAHCVPHADAAG
jgi:dienelactone hydrolase